MADERITELSKQIHELGQRIERRFNDVDSQIRSFQFEAYRRFLDLQYPRYSSSVLKQSADLDRSK